MIIEKDERGFFTATVPALPGHHPQARSLGELMDRKMEAIALGLEVEGTPPGGIGAPHPLVGRQTPE